MTLLLSVSFENITSFVYPVFVCVCDVWSGFPLHLIRRVFFCSSQSVPSLVCLRSNVYIDTVSSSLNFLRIRFCSYIFIFLRRRCIVFSLLPKGSTVVQQLLAVVMFSLPRWLVHSIVRPWLALAHIYLFFSLLSFAILHLFQQRLVLFAVFFRRAHLFFNFYFYFCLNFCSPNLLL